MNNPCEASWDSEKEGGGAGGSKGGGAGKKKKERAVDDDDEGDDDARSAVDDSSDSSDGEGGKEEAELELSPLQRMERLLVSAGKGGEDGKRPTYKVGETQPLVEAVHAMRRGIAIQVWGFIAVLSCV